MSYLGTKNFELEVAKGEVVNHSTYIVNGHSLNITNTERDIWESTGDINLLSAATQLQVSSSSALDIATGNGAKTVFITGLRGDYSSVGEVVALNGRTPVTTSESFLRINKVVVGDAGTLHTNQGDIYIYTGAA